MELERVKELQERVCARLKEKPFGAPTLLVEKAMQSEVVAAIQARNPLLAAYFQEQLAKNNEEVDREKLMKVSDELQMIELSRWIAG